MREDLKIKVDKAKEIILQAKDKAEESNKNLNVSLSFGIDSLVLSHIADSVGVNNNVFFNTGIEVKPNVKLYKSTKGMYPNLEVRTPKKSMDWVYKNKGFPIGTKAGVEKLDALKKLLTSNDTLKSTYRFILNVNNMGLANSQELGYTIKMSLWVYEALMLNLPLTKDCCTVLKKSLIKDDDFNLVGEMSADSNLRATSFKTHGYVGDNKAVPIIDFTKDDIWDYLNEYNIKYSTHYERGVTDNSGCFNCAMGTYKELDSGYDRLATKWESNYPKQYEKHMNKRHKDGMTFRETWNHWKNIIKSKNHNRISAIRTLLILLLIDKLDNLKGDDVIPYNKEFTINRLFSIKPIISKKEVNLIHNAFKGRIKESVLLKFIKLYE